MINSYNEKLIEIAASGLPRARNLKRALVNGANIDHQSRQNGYTALMYAVSVQHDRIAEYLLSQGANPLLKNNNNQTVRDLVLPSATVLPILLDFELFFAAKNNDLEGAQQLVELGASIDFVRSKGYTSLLVAAENNNFELVEYFLNQGADPSQTTTEGKTVFDLVSNSEVLDLLKNAKLADMDAREASQKTTLNRSTFFPFSIKSPRLSESTI